MFLIFYGCSGSEKSDVVQERLLDREEQRRLGNALQYKGDSDSAVKASQAATEITIDIAMDVVVYLRSLSAARRKKLCVQNRKFGKFSPAVGPLPGSRLKWRAASGGPMHGD